MSHQCCYPHAPLSGDPAYEQSSEGDFESPSIKTNLWTTGYPDAAHTSTAPSAFSNRGGGIIESFTTSEEESIAFAREVQIPEVFLRHVELVSDTVPLLVWNSYVDCRDNDPPASRQCAAPAS